MQLGGIRYYFQPVCQSISKANWQIVSPLFSLTRPGYMLTPVTREFRFLNKEALFDVEYERTNERIESNRNYPAQSFNSIVLNIIFHAAVIHTTNLSNILPRWIFLFVDRSRFTVISHGSIN